MLCQLVVADETGKISMTLWDHDGSGIRTGEIFQLSAGYVPSYLSPCLSRRYCSLYRNQLVLYVGGRAKGSIKRIGEYDRAGSLC